MAWAQSDKSLLPAMSLPNECVQKEITGFWADVGTQRDPLRPVLMDFKDTIVHYFLKHISNVRWFWC